nr:hypothetical protein Iba_chr03aCG3980 [Ipomoea batatas]
MDRAMLNHADMDGRIERRMAFQNMALAKIGRWGEGGRASDFDGEGAVAGGGCQPERRLWRAVAAAVEGGGCGCEGGGCGCGERWLWGAVGTPGSLEAGTTWSDMIGARGLTSEELCPARLPNSAALQKTGGSGDTLRSVSAHRERKAIEVGRLEESGSQKPRRMSSPTPPWAESRIEPATATEVLIGFLLASAWKRNGERRRCMPKITVTGGRAGISGGVTSSHQTTAAIRLGFEEYRVKCNTRLLQKEENAGQAPPFDSIGCRPLSIDSSDDDNVSDSEDEISQQGQRNPLLVHVKDPKYAASP